eukprot:6470778-Alexandrium_andersonii.AAC.1
MPLHASAIPGALRDRLYQVGGVNQGGARGQAFAWGSVAQHAQLPPVNMCRFAIARAPQSLTTSTAPA